jgi:peroxiredoxin
MFRVRLVCGLLLTTLFFVQGVVQAEDAPRTKVALGDKVPDFTFKDIRYLVRSLDDFGDKKAYVIVFTNVDCPLVQRYLPRIVRLDDEYREKGVQFLAMNVGPGDSIVENAYHAIQYDARFPFVKDYDGEAIEATGVRRTPEVVILDGDRKLRYRGRIDSQYRLGGVRPDSGREDLREALDDVLAQRDVRVAETAVDGCLITTRAPRDFDFEVTYAEHIAPLMQKHCQECHRPGTTAPFSLLSYDDTVTNAEMIGEVVDDQRMPPSYSSLDHGDIVNRRNLEESEIALITHWVNNGTPLGDEKKMPPPREFAESKWVIGEPDVIVKMAAKAKLPADGYVPYKYAFLPMQFKEDTWVEKVQILPGNHAAVHHCNLVAIKDMKLDDPLFITGYVPGGVPMVINENEGFRIPKGSVLVLQLHYITTGQPEVDQTSVGLVFCKGRVDREVRHFQVTTSKYAIPPEDPNYKVVARRTFAEDSTGIGMFSHMHLRGKDMVFNATYPDGTKEILLAVPNYSFDWQMAYRWAANQKKFPKGTVIECVAHYDNSSFNPYNPDPKATVRHGSQTFHEMMYGFVFFTHANEKLNLYVDPETGHVVENPAKPDSGDQAGD